ncbi:MAG: acyl-CoA dehydrogenase family protein [Actinomycetota bacterium]
MDFVLSEEQTQARKLAAEFAADVIRPVAQHYDQVESFPWEVLRKAAEAGLFGRDFFEAQRQDPTGLLAPLISEEFAWGCGGIALAVLSSRLPYYALMTAGTEDQVETWASEMFGTIADPKVAAFALTEPQGGSDVAAIRTSAVKEGGEWVLNGSKAFVTNGGIAGVYVVVASADLSLGTGGHALFMVPSDTPGVSSGPKDRKLGVRASHTCSLELRDVRIPGDHVLGGADALEERVAPARRDGQKSARSTALGAIEMTRPLVAAQAVGVARASLEFAAVYAGTRVQFGRVLSDHQAISHLLASMAVEVEAARLLVWRAACSGASGAADARMSASMAKFKAAEVAGNVTDKALQVLGGAGYMKDLPVEKWYRDAKVYGLLEGTSEIQLGIIAKQMGGASNALPKTPEGV